MSDISGMNETNHILIVDDAKNILATLQARLESKGFTVDTAISPKKALELLGSNSYSAVLSDMRMPEMDGLELMERIDEIDSELPVIFMTAHGDIKIAVESMKHGAFHFMEKTIDRDELVKQLKDAVNIYNAKKQQGNTGDPFSKIIAESEPMKRLLERVRMVLDCSSTTALIHGESGTGKELIASLLHHGGKRQNEKFVVIDCGATHGALLESELFGHVKGAFTGASKDKEGLFERAHGGTIFLDEVASISREMQKKLLRVIQEGEIRKVGSTSYKKVDVRIISATNRDLLEEVKSGRFREDLYYRLKVLCFDLPPLRDRKDDIAVLAKHFLREFSLKMGKNVSGFEDSVIDKMLAYDWPGNIRELKNVVESSTALSKGDRITEE